VLSIARFVDGEKKTQLPKSTLQFHILEDPEFVSWWCHEVCALKVGKLVTKSIVIILLTSNFKIRFSWNLLACTCLFVFCALKFCIRVYIHTWRNPHICIHILENQTYVRTPENICVHIIFDILSPMWKWQFATPPLSESQKGTSVDRSEFWGYETEWLCIWKLRRQIIWKMFFQGQEISTGNRIFSYWGVVFRNFRSHMFKIQWDVGCICFWSTYKVYF